MIKIRRTEQFSRWLRGLDAMSRARVLNRIDRLRFGNPGDVAPAGGGVSELRINYGPGYRVYFVRRGNEIVLLLCGGNKSTQQKDIKAARELAAELD